MTVTPVKGDTPILSLFCLSLTHTHTHTHRETHLWTHGRSTDQFSTYRNVWMLKTIYSITLKDYISVTPTHAKTDNIANFTYPATVYLSFHLSLSYKHTHTHTHSHPLLPDLQHNHCSSVSSSQIIVQGKTTNTSMPVNPKENPTYFCDPRHRH